MHQVAAHWIVGLLRDRNIPFLICGGLAARGYGSERALNDIDLFVPGTHFGEVVQAGHDYVSKSAARRQEEGWYLTYVQFTYEGIKVEVGNADDARIFDMNKQTWIQLNIDFSRYKTVRLLGMDLPLMLKEDLVKYKSALSRPVDIQDVRDINERE
ncbi:hypothetical protein [Onishia niordana]|uniref:hypothetical protein n=1 Tax=Onishia niordana TaxID=2508711 RepID=UPI00109FB146|nr:hypothetical protein [Halomonas niordiana]